MALYGYARVSMHEQDPPLQTTKLRAAGSEIIRAERPVAVAGTDALNSLLLEFLRLGDTLMVTRVDRLAKNVKELQDIVYTLNQQGITLRPPSSLLTRKRRQKKPSVICWSIRGV